MEIKGLIRYFKPYLAGFEPKTLETYSLDEVREGMALRLSAFYVLIDGQKYAVSRWTGPKRTRTYPYQHVYDTLHHKPKVTLIPYVKDEGRDGDRDFLQWDTVSLMTLLGVHVIVTYHIGADRSKRKGSDGKQKITGHRVDTVYIAERLRELSNYHHDAVHWNQQEITEYLPAVVDQVIEYYPKISTETGIPLKSVDEIIRRREQLADFQTYSRIVAVQAQRREQMTDHMNERSLSGAKASITITNFFNGAYYFTVDEAHVRDETVFLVEKKHGKGLMPASSDIKDGLLKLVLYHNLESVTVAERQYTRVPVLGLTSDRVRGYVHSLMPDAALEVFLSNNPALGAVYRRRLLSVFEEARRNHFVAYLSETGADTDAREALFTAKSLR